MELALNTANDDAKLDGKTVPRSAYIWVLILCALPTITAWLSFSPDGEFSYTQLVARQFWLPTTMFEIATIIFAISSGFSIQKNWLAFGRSTKILTSVWAASMVLATAFAEYANPAILSLVSWMIHALFAMATLYLFGLWRNAGSLNALSSFANAMPVGAALYVFTIAVFVAMVGTSTEFDWVSSQPGFPHIRHSGYFLITAMALSAGLIATRFGWQRIFHTALLSLGFGFAIWIGSRGPLIAFLGVLAASLLVFRTMRNARTLGFIAVAIAAGTLLSQAVPVPNHTAFNVIARFSELKSGTAQELSSNRTEFWRQTSYAIMAQPIIGHGGNQFRLQIPMAASNYNHPHNSMLQFAYEWGLLGAIAILALLGLTIIRLGRIALANTNLLLAPFLAAVSMAVFSLIDGVFYYNLPIMLFLTCAAAIFVHGKSPHPN